MMRKAFISILLSLHDVERDLEPAASRARRRSGPAASCARERSRGSRGAGLWSGCLGQPVDDSPARPFAGSSSPRRFADGGRRTGRRADRGGRSGSAGIRSSRAAPARRAPRYGSSASRRMYRRAICARRRSSARSSGCTSGCRGAIRVRTRAPPFNSFAEQRKGPEARPTKGRPPGPGMRLRL